MTYPSSTPFLSFPFINNRRVALFSKQYSHSSFHLVREITISNLSNYFKTFELKKKKKREKKDITLLSRRISNGGRKKDYWKTRKKRKKTWNKRMESCNKSSFAVTMGVLLDKSIGRRSGRREERRGEREEKKKVSPTVTNKALHSSRSSC